MYLPFAQVDLINNISLFILMKILFLLIATLHIYIIQEILLNLKFKLEHEIYSRRIF